MQNSENSQSCYKYFGLYDESSKIPLPIRSVLINVTINEYIAEVVYSQTYYNPYDEKIEAEYVFPISSTACFNKFEAKFGATVIQGIIKEKNEAKAYHEQNKQNGGDGAYAQISEENYDKMFVSISNLPPQSEIEIVFSYIERLEVALNKFWRFTLSSFTVPLYNNQKNNNSKANNEHDEILNSLLNSIPDSDLIKWELQISINSRSQIAFVKSTSHEIEISHSAIGKSFRAEIAMDQKNRYLPEKDFVVLYATDSINKPGYLLSPFEHGYCTLLSFFPSLDYLSFDDAYRASLEGKDQLKFLAAQSKNEFIFIVDKSAFAHNIILSQTKETLKCFITDIPNESYFNIVGIGGQGVVAFAGESVQRDSLSLLMAQKHINNLETNTKGIQLGVALDLVAKKEFIKGYSRVIILLTGEQTSNKNTDRIAKTIKDKLFKTRLFVVGIGERSLTHFARRIGIEGNGILEVIRTQSEIPEKIRHILKTALMPYFTDFELKIEDKALFSYVIPLPKTLGWVSPNELVEFFIIFNHKLAELKMTNFTLRFYNSLNNRHEEYKGQISADFADLHESVVKLGMLKFCEDLTSKKDLYEEMKNNNMSEAFKKDVTQKLVATSLKYGILTKETAFVCVVKEGDDISRQIPTRRIVMSRKEMEYDIKEKLSDNQDGELVMPRSQIKSLIWNDLRGESLNYEDHSRSRKNSGLYSFNEYLSPFSLDLPPSRSSPLIEMRPVNTKTSLLENKSELLTLGKRKLGTDNLKKPGLISRLCSWLKRLFFKNT